MKTTVMTLLAALLVTVLFALPARAQRSDAATQPVPQWRDRTPSAAFLGPDVLWRPRESLIFHMQDDRGTGFTLNVTVRDMNTYQQGPRPVMLWVVGPNGKTLVQTILEDDGVVAGNDRYNDGVYDPWQDFRYREWHRVHSPNGVPAGKVRSPYLTHPETLPARVITAKVPDAGKGLYRVTIMGGWDHWVSVTPDRPIATGVHPGAGPLYVHGDRLKDAYLYTPANAKDLNFTVSEEIQPFNWTVAVEEETGAKTGTTTPRSFMSYLIVQQAKPDAVYRMRVTGETTGACLHVKGAPMLICPNAETARKLRGGGQTDAKGRITYHRQQRVLNAWADSLKPEELLVKVGEARPNAIADMELRTAVAAMPKLLKSQDIDPASPHCGTFAPDPVYNFWNSQVDQLAKAAGMQAEGNPYYGNPAVIKRVLLGRMVELRQQSPFFWFDMVCDGPWEYTAAGEENNFWETVALRSSYYGLSLDGLHIQTLHTINATAKDVLPAAVVAAWRDSFDHWGISRTLMHGGEASNQWCESLSIIADVYETTRNPALLAMLDRQIGMLTTPGLMGRTNPDPPKTPRKSAAGYTLDADCGALGIGSLSDGFGYDAEYCLEEVLFINRVWQLTRDPRILQWWDRYAYLQAHLALTAEGVPVRGPEGLVCPTDMSHRSPFPHAHPAFSKDAEPLVPSMKRWGALFPCFEDEPFTRVIDNQFYFIKTPAYYSINYGGNGTNAWGSFSVATVKDGSASIQGYSGMNYTGIGYKATKLAGISAVFVKDCGPTFFSNNADVMYSNTVWGRRKTPVTPKWQEGYVDPYIITSGYTDPVVEFNARGRLYRASGVIDYAPLAFDRTVHYQDDRIVVTLVVMATDDLDLTELYEALPYYAAGREVRLYDKELTETAKLSVGDKDAETTAVTFRAVDIAAPNGAGASILFSTAQEFKHAKVLTLSRGLGQMRSFNLPLNEKMKAGERQIVRYVIYPHAKAITPEQLRRIAAEERF